MSTTDDFEKQIHIKLDQIRQLRSQVDHLKIQHLEKICSGSSELDDVLQPHVDKLFQGPAPGSWDLGVMVHLLYCIWIYH